MSYAADNLRDKHTDSKILSTPTDIVGVGNYSVAGFSLVNKYANK